MRSLIASIANMQRPFQSYWMGAVAAMIMMPMFCISAAESAPANQHAGAANLPKPTAHALGKLEMSNINRATPAQKLARP